MKKANYFGTSLRNLRLGSYIAAGVGLVPTPDKSIEKKEVKKESTLRFKIDDIQKDIVGPHKNDVK